MNMPFTPFTRSNSQPISNVDYIYCVNCGRTVQQKIPLFGSSGHRFVCNCGWFKNVWSTKVA